MRKLERMIESNTDSATASLRVIKIRQKFASLKRSYFANKRYTSADAYEGCLRYAESLGWLVKAKEKAKASTTDFVISNDKDVVDEIDKEPSVNENGFELKEAKGKKSGADDAKVDCDFHVSDKERSMAAVRQCLKDASARLDELFAQIRSNKKPTTPDYELNSRTEYLKGMFDREMRFPIRDRWNSFEEAKLHADKAYKTCLDHALRMGWIDDMAYTK